MHHSFGLCYLMMLFASIPAKLKREASQHQLQTGCTPCPFLSTARPPVLVTRRPFLSTARPPACLSSLPCVRDPGGAAPPGASSPAGAQQYAMPASAPKGFYYYGGDMTTAETVDTLQKVQALMAGGGLSSRNPASS